MKKSFAVDVAIALMALIGFCLSATDVWAGRNHHDGPGTRSGSLIEWVKGLLPDNPLHKHR